MSETTITRKQALSIAITAVNYLNTEDIAIGGLTGDDYFEVAAVLGKMLDSISKPRKSTVSKARVMNENLARWAHENAPETVTTKDVVNLGNPEIATTQKAAAVLRVAVELGLFEKLTDGKKVTYHKVG